MSDVGGAEICYLQLVTFPPKMEENATFSPAENSVSCDADGARSRADYVGAAWSVVGWWCWCFLPFDDHSRQLMWVQAALRSQHRCGHPKAGGAALRHPALSSTCSECARSMDSCESFHEHLSRFRWWPGACEQMSL